MRNNDFGFKVALATVGVLIGLTLFRLNHPSTTFAADGIDRDWDAAAQRSHEAKLPAVVLFTANWCPVCQALHNDVLSRGDVREELENHYSFYTVDLTDPSPQVQAHAQKFGVKYIPLLIRYDANGHETDRTNYLGPAEMMGWLKAGE